jgi:hypothetical protein
MKVQSVLLAGTIQININIITQEGRSIPVIGSILMGPIFTSAAKELA